MSHNECIPHLNASHLVKVLQCEISSLCMSLLLVIAFLSHAHDLLDGMLLRVDVKLSTELRKIPEFRVAPLQWAAIF